jgi:hypothetical protein
VLLQGRPWAKDHICAVLHSYQWRSFSSLIAKRAAIISPAKNPPSVWLFFVGLTDAAQRSSGKTLSSTRNVCRLHEWHGSKDAAHCGKQTPFAMYPTPGQMFVVRYASFCQRVLDLALCAPACRSRDAPIRGPGSPPEVR